MSAIVRFTPRTEHGRSILDELERRTGAIPFRTDQSGSREYWLTGSGEAADDFDSTLGKIAPDWREHLDR